MSEVDPNGIAQHTAGAKLDANKVDMSLLGLWPRALFEVCRVGTMGAEKYSRGGFLSVANGFIRYTAAMFRHYFKECTGQVYDDDPYYDTVKGLAYKNRIRHDAQVAWNSLSRLEMKLKEEEQNERTNKEQPQSLDRIGAVQQGPVQFIGGGGFSVVQPTPRPGAVINKPAGAGPGWPYDGG